MPFVSSTFPQHCIVSANSRCRDGALYQCRSKLFQGGMAKVYIPHVVSYSEIKVLHSLVLCVQGFTLYTRHRHRNWGGGGGTEGMCPPPPPTPSFHKLLYKLLTTLCVVSRVTPPPHPHPKSKSLSYAYVWVDNSVIPT